MVYPFATTVSRTSYGLAMLTWIPLAVLSAVFAALVAIFGKIGVSHIDSTFATSVRAVVMAVFLVAISVAQGKWALFSTLDRRAFAFIVASGVAGALSWLCYFLALRTGPATGTAALDRLSVVFVLIFAALFLGEAFTPATALGAVLITAGAILLVVR
jgi:transporter family protein